MRTYFIGAVVALTVSLSGGTALAAWLNEDNRPEATPCATEDSPGPCYWDAQKQGNGKGRSFLVSQSGVVTYR